MSQPLVHITGARPNFPKLAPVVRAVEMPQVIVHTGQHYDDKLSDIFFRDLDLPRPDINLGIGSGSHAEQTGAVMVALEKTFADLKPALVMVYGDINSTVAAALVAAKMSIPLAHVEAGLRSFDRTMPEEINRLVTDRLSDLLFATSEDAVEHLLREGTDKDAIHFVGNPMIDTLLRLRDSFDPDAARSRFGLDGDYVVATAHRPSNVDDDAAVRTTVASLHAVADHAPVLLPLHPRGAQRLRDVGLERHPRITITDPLGYIEFMGAVSGARCVVTDSGGVQEETTVLGIPCLTVRPNTERPVTITHGTNRLVTWEDVATSVAEIVATERAATWPTPPLWDGHAGERIAAAVASWLES